MQTLPTPMSQTKALTLADVANQNNVHVNVDKNSTENTKVSFHAELTKQVRAKQTQAQTKQDKVAEPVKNKAQNASVEDTSELDKDFSTRSKNLNKAQSEGKFFLDLSSQTETTRDLSARFAINEVEVASPTSDTPAVMTNNEAAVADLISALGIPVAQGNLNNTNQTQVTSALESDVAISKVAELATSSKNLQAVINNPVATTQTESEVGDATLASPDDILKAKGEGLVDVTASRAELKTAVDDLGFKKALESLPTKEMPVKDTVSNITQALSTTVNTAQSNNNFVAQQLASTNLINVYPGKSGWDQAISQKVMWMVGAGHQSASLTLNPPDLGPLKVVINVHNDQADTTFISDNDEVRKALEAGMSHLRDKMNESGIQLGQANVSTSQQSQQDFQQTAQTKTSQSMKNQANTEVVDNVPESNITVRVSDGLVDTFA